MSSEGGPPQVIRLTRKNGQVVTFTARMDTGARGERIARRTTAPLPPGPPPEPPVTPEMFQALVADLRAELAAAVRLERLMLLSRQKRPEAFTGRPWVWMTVTLAEAAELTGLALTSLRRYSKPSDREAGRRRLPGTPMPPPLGRRS